MTSEGMSGLKGVELLARFEEVVVVSLNVVVVSEKVAEERVVGGGSPASCGVGVAADMFAISFPSMTLFRLYPFAPRSSNEYPRSDGRFRVLSQVPQLEDVGLRKHRPRTRCFLYNALGISTTPFTRAYAALFEPSPSSK